VSFASSTVPTTNARFDWVRNAYGRIRLPTDVELRIASVDIRLLSLNQVANGAQFKHRELKRSFAVLVPSVLQMSIVMVLPTKPRAMVTPTLEEFYRTPDVALAGRDAGNLVDAVQQLVRNPNLHARI